SWPPRLWRFWARRAAARLPRKRNDGRSFRRTAAPRRPSRLMTHRVTSLFAAGLIAAGLVAAPAAGALAKDSLVLAMVLEPPHLDPTAGAAAAIDEVVYANVFEG